MIFLVGAARVAFSNQKSYIAAITSRFVQLKHGDMDKKVTFVETVFSLSRDFCTLFFYKNIETENRQKLRKN